MPTAAEILNDAKRAPSRETLADHRETIETLRQKNYTWREIAEFLRERGMETDHSKLFRFMQPKGTPKMNASENFFVPSAQDYARALTDLKISDNQMKMLEFHYLAHNRTVNYRSLATRADSESFRAANSQYGKLGRALGEALSMNFVPDETEGEPFYSSAIGTGNPYKAPKAEFELVMHHELAKAIQQLGWFSS